MSRALKRDLVRTGTLTRRSAVVDCINSLQRYVLNNLFDSNRQIGIELLLGNSLDDIQTQSVELSFRTEVPNGYNATPSPEYYHHMEEKHKFLVPHSSFDRELETLLDGVFDL